MMTDDTNSETAPEMTSAELTLRDIITQNEFAENNALLKNEITEIDSLFTMTKKMLIDEVGSNDAVDAASNKPQRMGTVQAAPKRRNMMFISSQTTNLISMRNLKLQLIKQQSTLKQNMLDRNIRALSEIAKKNEGGDGDNTQALLDFVLNNLNLNIPVSPQQRQMFNLKPLNHGNVDDELDSVLDAAEDVEVKVKQVEHSAPPKLKKKVDPLQPKVTYGATTNLLVYQGSEDKVFIVTMDYDMVRELTTDEYELDMREDGTIVDTKSNTIIEVMEES